MSTSAPPEHGSEPARRPRTCFQRWQRCSWDPLPCSRSKSIFASTTDRGQRATLLHAGRGRSASADSPSNDGGDRPFGSRGLRNEWSRRLVSAGTGQPAAAKPETETEAIPARGSMMRPASGGATGGRARKTTRTAGAPAADRRTGLERTMSRLRPDHSDAQRRPWRR